MFPVSRPRPKLKEPGPIASDFGIRRKLIFFSLPLVHFTAENVPFGRYLNENVTSYGIMVTI